MTWRWFPVPRRAAALLIAAATVLGWSATGTAAVPGCRYGWDYGDAPAPYPTTRTQNGPRHLITTAGTLTIGATVTADRDGRPGDGDADDGLPTPVRLPTGAPRITVPVRNTTRSVALLVGWLDFSGHGFARRERVAARVPCGATRVVLRWSPPVPGPPGAGELRLRLFQGVPRDPAPVGPAHGGEVEDYRVTLAAPASPSPRPTPSTPASPRPAPPAPPARRPPAPAPPRPVPGATTVRPASPAATTRPESPATSPARPASPSPSPAAVSIRRTRPWTPRHGLPVTWSVVVLLVIPAVVGAAHVTGRRLAQRTR